MKLVLFLTCLLLGSALCHESEPQPQPSGDMSLRLLVEVCRHGARAPLWTAAKNDPLNPPESWVGGLGQLTYGGMRMHYLLGRELRRRYIEEMPFLSKTFDVKQIYVRCTDYDRTLQSAMSQLSGLYPPGTGPALTEEQSELALPPIQVAHKKKLQKELKSAALPNFMQVIPIHVVAPKDEHILLGFSDTTCPRVQELVAEGVNEPWWKQQEIKYKPVLKKFEEMFWYENQTLSLLESWKIRDLLIAEKVEGRTMPEGVTDELMQLAADVYDVQVANHFRNLELRRLANSEFFRELTRLIDAQITGEAAGQRPDLRFAFFSAHDTTVAAFLAGFDVEDNHNPPFASTLMFELHKRPGADASISQYFVRLIYNDKPLLIPVCGTIDCPYSVLRAFMQSRMIDNIKEACRARKQLSLNLVSAMKYY